MRYGERSDTELVLLAREGWSPAFATLLHRHAATVLAARDHPRDPEAVLTATYVRAMRRLRRFDEREAVAVWLSDCAGGPRWRRRRRRARRLAANGARAQTADEPTEVIKKPDHDAPTDLGHDRDNTVSIRTASLRTASSPDGVDLDTVWTELLARWPRGRRRRRVPAALVWLVTIVAVVAVSAAVPWYVLGPDRNALVVDQQVRAVPIDDGLMTRPEEQDAIVEDAAEPLPEFEFPTPAGDFGTEGSAPSQASAPDSAEPDGAVPDSAEPAPAPVPDAPQDNGPGEPPSDGSGQEADGSGGSPAPVPAPDAPSDAPGDDSPGSDGDSGGSGSADTSGGGADTSGSSGGGDASGSSGGGGSSDSGSGGGDSAEPAGNLTGTDG